MVTLRDNAGRRYGWHPARAAGAATAARATLDRAPTNGQKAIEAARETAREHGVKVYVLLGKTGLFVSSKRHGGEVLYAVHTDGHVESLR